MHKDIVPFVFEDHLVRVVTREGEPWFVMADVCRVLEIADTGTAARRLDDDEKGVHSMHTLGGLQDVTIINESGLYSLVLTSRKPAAKRFKKWVTAEVLPTLRRTGSYELPAGDEPAPVRIILPGHPDFSQAVRLVREARLSRGAEAALAVWRSIGLPWVPELETPSAVGGAAAVPPGEDDAVARFALEGIERAPGVTTPSAMLWPAFMQFCAVHGLAHHGERSFATRFGRMGFAKRKVAGRMVYLHLRPRVVTVSGLGGQSE